MATPRWLQRLFHLFAKKAPRTIVHIDDLNEWIEKELIQAENDRALLYSKARASYLSARADILSKTAHLEEASLRNDAIPEREKHIMEGNRQEFVRRVRRLVDEEPPTHEDQFSDFMDAYIINTKEFATGSRRPFAALQHFFADESKAVMRGLTDAEHILLECAGSMLFTSVQHLRKARDALIQYKTKRAHRQELADRRQVLDKELQIIDIEIARTQRELEKTQSSQANTELEQKKTDLQHVLNTLKTERDTMVNYFATIEPALNRYIHTSVQHKALATSYLHDPIEALARDRAFMLGAVLHAIDVGLKNKTLDVAEKRHAAILDVIKELTPQRVTLFLTTYSTLMKKRDTLLAAVQQMPVLTTLRELKQQLESSQAERQQKEAERERVIEEHAAIDDVALFRALQRSCDELVAVTVVQERAQQTPEPTSATTA